MFSSLSNRGASRIWTGDDGVADRGLTTWLCHHIILKNSPSRARTYNNSVNSRVLYHWAIEDYAKGFVYTFKTDTEPFYIYLQVKLPVD